MVIITIVTIIIVTAITVMSFKIGSSLLHVAITIMSVSLVVVTPLR